jgi:ectoine hydroxylase-related dioxygenase (phytanoyl-CoA dioxygenase family)
MNTTLTDQQINDYREQGFLYVPQFLSADEVDQLKGAVLEAVGQMGNKKVAKNAAESDENMEDGESYYSKVFTQRLNLWKINDTVKQYMLSEDLGRMITDMCGVDGFRVWHDQMLTKEPYGNPTAWHLDNPYWSFSSRDSVSIWIALEDATYENGCMWFVPGSHKISTYDNVGIDENLASLFDVYPEMKEVDPIGVPMKAGDCSFHNGLTAHGAGANMTRQRRIAMTCGYMPVGSTFNGQGNILSKNYLDTIEVGDELKNDENNPIVYSKDAA